MADIILHQQVSINNETTLPTASEGYRGIIMVEKGGALVADTVKVCIKTAIDTYIWKEISLL
jgi:hypothetical protein